MSPNVPRKLLDFFEPFLSTKLVKSLVEKLYGVKLSFLYDELLYLIGADFLGAAKLELCFASAAINSSILAIVYHS
jgi:hypothetical protein